MIFRSLSIGTALIAGLISQNLEAVEEDPASSYFADIWMDKTGTEFPAGMQNPSSLHKRFLTDQVDKDSSAIATNIYNTISSVNYAKALSIKSQCKSSICEAYIIYPKRTFFHNRKSENHFTGVFSEKMNGLSRRLDRQITMAILSPRRKPNNAILVYFYQ